MDRISQEEFFRRVGLCGYIASRHQSDNPASRAEAIGRSARERGLLASTQDLEAHPVIRLILYISSPDVPLDVMYEHRAKTAQLGALAWHHYEAELERIAYERSMRSSEPDVHPDGVFPPVLVQDRTDWPEPSSRAEAADERDPRTEALSAQKW
jgi:hypothetical protein